MIAHDTIAAISSAAAPAARIIVRISGSFSHAIARRLVADLTLEPASAQRVTLAFQELAVPAWAYVFASPRSYSGEDLVELHIPGNPLLARILLDELCRLGARAAEPGEFTARAYFHGKMDLSEAEGVAATIAAGNEAELRAARQLLAGELANRLKPLMELLAETLALVEVGIDFSEEDVRFLTQEEIEQRIAKMDHSLAELVENTSRFERLSHEPQLVLVGRPNAGKSTLLNALAGQERAVVSPVAGTTRDAISAELRVPGGVVRIIDAAGLDELPGPDDAGSTPAADITRQMRRQALRTVELADVVVLVKEIADDREDLPLPQTPDLRVISKLDLKPESPTSGDAVVVSSLKGTGMETLRERLSILCFGEASARPSLALNARHLAAIADARDALNRAAERVRSDGVEIIALELREALDALGSILGQVTPDELLGRIFASFCIGK